MAINNNILAITQRENINRGGRQEVSEILEVNGSIVINRIFENLRQQKSIFYCLIKYKKIIKIIKKFAPDVIFCEEISNMYLAVKIKKDFNIPLILRVEFLHDEKSPYRVMGQRLRYLKNIYKGDYLAILIGKLIFGWAYKNSDAIISCYFEEKPNIILKEKLFIIPWPTFKPKFKGNFTRKNRAVFIGSFDEHKNLKELEITIPLLFHKTPLEEFYIVGTGNDLKIIDDLKHAYPGKIKHFVSLSREKCLELIESAFISYSPAVRGGWGFIGDSWAMKTPIVVTHNHYGFLDKIDSFITSPDQIDIIVNEIYNNEPLYQAVSSGGYKRFVSHHTAEAVSQKYYAVCNEVIYKKADSSTK